MTSTPARVLAWATLATPAALLLGALLVPLFTTTGIHAVGTVLTTQTGLVTNTVTYGLLTAVAGTALGWLLAHVLHTWRTPGRRVLHALYVAPLLLPSFTFAMALIVLFGHSGWITSRLAPDVDLYGFPGLVLAGTLSRFPLAYLTMSWAYRRISPELREAALDLGASPAMVTRQIVLPRLMPGLVSSLLFCLGDAIADVAIPLVIGGGYPTLAGRLYEAVAAEGDLSTAVAYALLLTIPAALVWLLAFRVAGTLPDRIGTLPLPPARPGPLGHCLQALAWLVAALIATLGLAILISSLQSSTGWPSLVAYRAILTGQGIRPLAMSLLIALVVAPLVIAVGFLVTRASARGRGSLRRAGRLLNALSAIPPAVLGLGAYLAVESSGSLFDHLGLPPAATPWLAILAIICVHLVRFTPRVAQPALAGAAQLLPQARDTAVQLGAKGREFSRWLLWPRVRGDLSSGGLTAFADTLTAASSVILLTNLQVPLLPVEMLRDIDAGRLPSASAATVMLSLVVLVVAGLVTLWRSEWTRRRSQE